MYVAPPQVSRILPVAVYATNSNSYKRTDKSDSTKERSGFDYYLIHLSLSLEYAVRVAGLKG